MPFPAIHWTLRVHMASQGLTPTRLANLAGLSSDVIAKAVRGEKISRSTAEKICKALGVGLGDVEGLNYRNLQDDDD